MVVEEDQGFNDRPRQPHVALHGPPLLVVDDRHRALVGLQVVECQHVVPQAVVHRPHQVGHAVEPALNRTLLELYSQALEHPDLAVEGQMVGILADDELGEQRSAGITLGEGFRGDRGGEDGVVRLAHGLVPYRDPDPHVGGGHLQVLGCLHGFEQHPVLLVAEISLRVDMLLHAAQVLRQLVADGNLLDMLLHLHFLSGLGDSLGGLPGKVPLLVGEVLKTEVKPQLVGVFGSLALLAHPAPQLAGHVFKLAHEVADLVLLLGELLLIIRLHVTDSLLVVSLHVTDPLLVPGLHVTHLFVVACLHLLDTGLV